MSVLPCDAVGDLMFQLLDGELGEARASALREHLAGCASCGAAARRDEAFLAALARAATLEPAPPALRARIAAMLAERERSGSARTDVAAPEKS